MPDSSPRQCNRQADLVALRWLAAMPAFGRWRKAAMPDAIRQWLREADEQELMTVVAAGLTRLQDEAAAESAA